jgi:hypothetical protein
MASLNGGNGWAVKTLLGLATAAALAAGGFVVQMSTRVAALEVKVERLETDVRVIMPRQGPF